MNWISISRNLATIPDQKLKELLVILIWWPDSFKFSALLFQQYLGSHYLKALQLLLMVHAK